MFRDTWQLGIHSYLSYIRDRLFLAKELLKDEGSIFIQISDENVHHIREICDEIFGSENFMTIITFKVKNMPFGSNFLENMNDYIIWYSKDKSKTKYTQLFSERPLNTDEYSFVELETGERRKLSTEEKKDLRTIPKNSKLFSRLQIFSSGYTPSCIFDFEFEGEIYQPRAGRSWKTTKAGMEALKAKKRLIKLGSKLYYVFYYDDYPIVQTTNYWDKTAGGYTDAKRYVVETSPLAIEKTILMTTSPGDLVLA